MNRLIALVVALWFGFWSLPVSGQIAGQHRKVFSGGVATPGFVSGRVSSHTCSNVSGCGGATYSAVSTQAYSGTGACPTDSYCVPLPQPSLSGNALTLGILYSSTPSTTLTIATDQSQSLTVAATSSAVASKLAAVAYLCGATAGTQYVSITASSAITIYNVYVEQWDGIATSSCVDTQGTNGSGSTTTTLTGPTLNTTVANDLIVNHAYRATATPVCTSNPCFTVASGYTLQETDWVEGGMMEYEVDTGTGNITPSPTQANATTYIATAIALKQATAGTAPTGMYVRQITPCNTPTAAATTQSCQFPSAGNLVVGLNNCGGPYVTSVTDATNTWKLATNSGVNAHGAGSFGDSFYAPNAAANATGALTLNYTWHSGSDNDCTTFLYDIAGAATAPLASSVYSLHNVDGVTSSTLTFMSNFEPEMTTGLVLAAISNNTNTVTYVTSPSGALLDSATYGGQSENGPSLPDQNNGWFLLPNTAATAQNWTAGYIKSDTRGGWLGQVLAFVASTGSLSGPSIVQRAQNQATSASTLTVGSGQGWTSSGANTLVAVVGRVGGTSVSHVCTDGTTCAAGNAFTCVAAATLSTQGTTVCYLTGHAAGVTAIEAQFTASASNSEMGVFEVANISGLDTSNSTSSGTGTGTNDVGASVTSTGSPSICMSITTVSNAVNYNPTAGNPFGYGNGFFSNTADAYGTLIAAAGTYHYDVTDAGSGSSYANSIGCFK
jgi:hypothetical protein